jgi:hypothetical protein
LNRHFCRTAHDSIGGPASVSKNRLRRANLCQRFGSNEPYDIPAPCAVHPKSIALSRVTTIAVVCQLLAGAYLQLVEWVDLFPWNDLAKGNQQEVLDVVLLASQALVAFWFARRWLALMVVGWAAYAWWLYLQIVSWWQPYLFGGRTVGPHWYFARTLKILPAIEGRPTPDANHMLLQLLLVAVLVSGAMAIWQTYADRRQVRRAAT